MHIVVCVKQTPTSTNVQIDPKIGTYKREGLSFALSPFDEYAIEEAVRLKERLAGSTVSVLTVGAPGAEDVLRDAIARGCDEAFLVTDPAFEGADSWSTAYTLQMAMKKLSETKKPFDLIICGKQTNDTDAGQVGPGLAAWLGLPLVAFVGKVEDIKEGSLRVRRMMEDGYDILEMPTPCVITVVKEINEPRVASLKGKMAAKKATIVKWSADDIKAEKDKIGLSGSPTVISKTSVPPARKGGERIEGVSADEKAKKLVARLREMKII